MDKRLVILILVLLLLSCGNKSREMQPIINDNLHVVEQEKPDTVSISIQEEAAKMEKKPSSSVSSSSSSRSHKSNKYDNMRGFDPASEDDMDDNGMSRYMENNDDEGWD